MAFSVTPTSGTVPFTYTAEFGARYALDAGLYVLQFYVQTTVGSCPPAGTLGTLQTAPAVALLNTGTYVQTMGTISAGSCRTATLVIREVATGNVVSQEGVSINNI